MRPSFHPRLVNSPFGDPALYIQFLYENRAILFDLGDLGDLSTRDLLKVSHVFVTHTHMDHFIGFDRLLRLFLGREKTLHLYGPEGFHGNVEGKLSGYTWNLVTGYRNRFNLRVTEVREDRLLTRKYRCLNGFSAEDESRARFFNPVLLCEPSFSVSAVLLNHRIPCLGLNLTERFHVNIKKDAVERLGLQTGPWLREFKQALFNGLDPDTLFDVKHSKTARRFPLGVLTDQIAMIAPGQRITYIADALFDPSQADIIVDFARHSDQLFIEAAFLEKDAAIAEGKYHLTARQAGTIAGRAQAKQFSVFHFSPRYTGLADLLEDEAQAAYRKARPVVEKNMT